MWGRSDKVIWIIIFFGMLSLVVILNFSRTSPSPPLSAASPASAYPSAPSNPSPLSTSYTSPSVTPAFY